MAELQSIMDALVTAQKAITAPTGEKAIKNAWDEPPGSIGAGSFPCVINLEEDGDRQDRAHGHPEVRHNIGMHLCLSDASTKYSVRLRRKWLQKFIDAFPIGQNTLSSNVDFVRSLTWDYVPFDWNGTAYAAINFTLEVEVDY